MEIKLTEKQFRRLLDLVYIGNWVLNSTRGDDRIRQYDQVESLIFSHCLSHGMAGLTELYQGEIIPSRAFAEGGIHEAIMAYEDNTFFEILAQELALRDMDDPPITEENYDEVMSRMDEYLGPPATPEGLLYGVIISRAKAAAVFRMPGRRIRLPRSLAVSSRQKWGGRKKDLFIFSAEIS